MMKMKMEHKALCVLVLIALVQVIPCSAGKRREKPVCQRHNDCPSGDICIPVFGHQPRCGGDQRENSGEFQNMLRDVVEEVADFVKDEKW